MGVTYRDFNNFPEKCDYPNIKGISFLVFDDELDRVVKEPDFLNSLKKLETLSIPIDWASSISIPEGITALRLLNSIHLKEKYNWPKDIVLRELKYLAVPELIKPFEINFKNTPSLEWIEIDLKAEKEDSKLKGLAKISSLKHLNFKQAKNFDVFSPFMSHDIKSIELFCCKGKQFPIVNMSSLRELEYVRINNISVELDCTIFLSLPKLIELDILNVNNISNTEKLLEIETLKSLSIFNCNSPIHNEEGFKNKGFDLLKISHA